MKRLEISQNGSVLIAIIIIMPMFMLIAASFMQLAVNNYRIARVDQYRTHAQFSVDAGIDATMEQINLDPVNYIGTSGEVEISSGGDVRRTYQTVVETPDEDNKTIIATGRTYFPASNTTPSSTVTVETKLRAVKSGDYSVVSGVGGLIMQNSAKVVNGSVFVNGKLDMSNTSQIGLSILKVNVDVAHQTCPAGSNPGPTYPIVCGSGQGQPITMNHSAHIYGDVRANNQTDGTSMSNNGLVASSGVTPAALPEYIRGDQTSAVTSTYNGNYTCSNSGQTWPANYKIDGDVLLRTGCTVTVEGNVWVTGNFDMRNLAQLIVKPSLDVSPVIMVDGPTGFSQLNSSALLPSLSSKGFRILTFYNATGDPNAVPTGTNLYNSQGINTIDLDNTASGLQTEYYARWSKITIGNSGAVGAIAGQTVELNNSAAITLGTSITGFSQTIWVIDSVRRTFN